MDYYNGGYPPPYYPPPPAYAPYYPPPKNPWLKPIRRNANILCFCLVMVVLLGIFVAPVFSGIADIFINNFYIMLPSAISLVEMVSELIVYLIMFAVPIGVIKLWVGIPPQVAFPMRRPRAAIAFPAIFACLGVSVVGMLLSGTLSYVLQALFGLEPYMPESPLPIGIAASVVYFIRLAVAPAVMEELMFRGVIMQSLRRFGDLFALVCSSILFALAHHNLVQGPNALLLGFAIGFFVLRTGSLKTGMIIHFVNNSLALCIDYMSRAFPDGATQVLINFVLLFYTASGLICFAFLFITRPEIFHLAPSSYPVAEKQKYAAFFLTAAPIVYIAAVTVITSFMFR